MWGYAQGNATMLGIVVAVIGVAAVAYLGRRLWRRGE
jgi:biopolymer transport protein ExbB/TolQ